MPVAAKSTTSLTLRDLVANKELGVLRVPKGEAVTNRIDLTINTTNTYQLVAEGKNRQVNHLTVRWATHGPALELAALPTEQEVFATPGAKATIGVFLAYRERRITPLQRIQSIHLRTG